MTKLNLIKNQARCLYIRMRMLRCRLEKRNKVFCIGRNKTGTTSVGRALRDMGYLLAPQKQTEAMYEDWAARDFRKLIRLCRNYNAFQDAPFSYPYTFVALDQSFPGSKFVLTVRESEDVWYDSLVRFHSKRFGNGQRPTAEQLKTANYYIGQGVPWKMQRYVFGIREGQEYDETIYKNHYIAHNNSVIDYFRWRPDDLLVLDVSQQGALQQLASFLGQPIEEGAEFPWENKT